MSQQHGKASTAVPSTSGKLSSTTAGGEAGIVETTEQQKIPKPSATEVTNKVLAVLMVSEPLTLADLCKQLPDLPRDSIQAVLEVLQVLALVVQLSTTKEAAASKSLSVNNQTFVFSLTEFAKFHTAFPITAIESEVKIMQSRNRDVRSRIEELQALTTLDEELMSPEQRMITLKELTTKFLQRSPQLRDDPLYQALLEQTNNSNVSNSSPPFASVYNSL